MMIFLLKKNVYLHTYHFLASSDFATSVNGTWIYCIVATNSIELNAASGKYCSFSTFI